MLLITRNGYIVVGLVVTVTVVLSLLFLLLGCVALVKYIARRDR